MQKKIESINQLAGPKELSHILEIAAKAFAWYDSCGQLEKTEELKLSIEKFFEQTDKK